MTHTFLLFLSVAIKVEKDDDHIVKNHSKDDNERNDEVDEKPKIHSPSKA